MNPVSRRALSNYKLRSWTKSGKQQDVIFIINRQSPIFFIVNTLVTAYIRNVCKKAVRLLLVKCYNKKMVKSVGGIFMWLTNNNKKTQYRFSSVQFKNVFIVTPHIFETYNG